MRTIAEIKDIMTQSFISDETIISKYSLDPAKTFDQQFSKVSIESILFYVVAAVIWTHEAIFDQHKTEVENIINEREPHSLRWYRNLALSFRYGYSRVADTDTYSDEAVADTSAAIIKYAAVKRRGNILYMKVAKDAENGLGALSVNEKAAFEEFIDRTMDAGVNMKIITQEADYLKLAIDIYYSPLVLDATGKRLDGNNDTPVQDAITAYMQNLPFDGDFTLTDLTDALQLVDGVEIPRVLGAEAKWGAYDWSAVVSKYNPEAGWLKIYDTDNDLTITWHANISE